MNRRTITVLTGMLVGGIWGLAAAETPAPIKTVRIGPHREFIVNGQPFFPIMGWLQDPPNLPKLKNVGMNCIAGYWRPRDGSKGPTQGADEYARHARQAGLYFLPPFDPQYMDEMRKLKDSDVVLAWMHSDEPDMPVTQSDAEIARVPGTKLYINSSRPLFKMLDGDPKTSAILDPVLGASFTIRLKAPITVRAMAIQNAPSAKEAVPKEVELAADGKPILKVAIQNSKELQKFDLPKPATFRELTVRVVSEYPGQVAWGGVAEIQALDAEGRNLLLSPTRKQSRESPEAVMNKYRAIRQFDASRPMFMTVTDFFIHDSVFDHWWTRQQQDEIYPQMVKATDVVGFDVYPLYGWNRPDKIAWVSQGMQDLRAYAGREKPIYQWIETQPGGRFGAKAAPVTGVEIRNEVWQAIIRGATALGYFTHRFKPTFAEFGVPEENQKAMLDINRQVTRLTPVIAAPDAARQPTIALEGGLPAQCLAKETPEATILFAQNIDAAGKSGNGTITLAGLKAQTPVEVVDESRTIAAEEGKFTDRFDRLAVHIYRIRKK